MFLSYEQNLKGQKRTLLFLRSVVDPDSVNPDPAFQINPDLGFDQMTKN
jgi:hypothetical protein